MAEENIHPPILLFRFSQAADDDDRDFRIHLTDKTDKVRPGGFRHDVVRDDYPDLLRVGKAAKQGKCAVGTGGYLYLESGLA